MPANVADHDLWTKAKARVREQYPDVAEGDDRFYRLVSGVYQKMGGAFTAARKGRLLVDLRLLPWSWVEPDGFGGLRLRKASQLGLFGGQGDDARKPTADAGATTVHAHQRRTHTGAVASVKEHQRKLAPHHEKIARAISHESEVGRSAAGPLAQHLSEAFGHPVTPEEVLHVVQNHPDWQHRGHIDSWGVKAPDYDEQMRVRREAGLEDVRREDWKQAKTRSYQILAGMPEEQRVPRPGAVIAGTLARQKLIERGVEAPREHEHLTDGELQRGIAGAGTGHRANRLTDSSAARAHADRWASLAQEARGRGLPVGVVPGYHPDGRLKPQPGDTVYQERAGFGGTPVHIHGKVHPLGGHVEIQGAAGMFSAGVAPVGKKVGLDGSWTVSGDPEGPDQKRERRLKENADREVQWQQEQKEAEDAAEKRARAHGPAPTPGSHPSGSYLYDELGETPVQLGEWDERGTPYVHHKDDWDKPERGYHPTRGGGSHDERFLRSMTAAEEQEHGIPERREQHHADREASLASEVRGLPATPPQKAPVYTEADLASLLREQERRKGKVVPREHEHLTDDQVQAGILGAAGNYRQAIKAGDLDAQHAHGREHEALATEADRRGFRVPPLWDPNPEAISKIPPDRSDWRLDDHAKHIRGLAREVAGKHGVSISVRTGTGSVRGHVGLFSQGDRGSGAAARSELLRSLADQGYVGLHEHVSPDHGLRSQAALAEQWGHDHLNHHVRYDPELAAKTKLNKGSDLDDLRDLAWNPRLLRGERPLRKGWTPQDAADAPEVEVEPASLMEDGTGRVGRGRFRCGGLQFQFRVVVVRVGLRKGRIGYLTAQGPPLPAPWTEVVSSGSWIAAQQLGRTTAAAILAGRAPDRGVFTAIEAGPL